MPTPGATPFPPLNFKNIGQQCPIIIDEAVNAIRRLLSSVCRKNNTKTKPLQKSNKKTIMPIFNPSTRVTFVAPVDPLPISSRFFLEMILVNMYPKGIDPIVYPINMYMKYSIFFSYF